MEFNEISLCMDVKLDIYDKRPDSLKFKTWTRCQVKIEAIKCLPCFLRITIQALQKTPGEQQVQQQQHHHHHHHDDHALLCVSINVPGVTISLATSRTKQYSYGLFWTHNRRDCFIYFASDTDVGCRKHMKWIKKSIKNLEVYRQVFLEQRRHSRSSAMITVNGRNNDKQKELSAVKDALSALGPLPEIPISHGNLNWSHRASRASDIYEEIFEGNVPPRLSRRLSRASVASGIYEEMKPYSQSVVDAILEEHLDSPPPLPPLPPHRKRLNTFESDSIVEIPRSNTNPESDLVKKKKYKNVLDNIFGTGRSSKRSESVSESAACTIEAIINGGNDANIENNPIYANDILNCQDPYVIGSNKRNSFSSPDLSKINFLDTFDEEKVAAFLLLQQSNDDLNDLDVDLEDMIVMVGAEGHNFSSISLDDSSIGPSASRIVMKRMHALKPKVGSAESLNISEQLPQNFNFSACNSSSINLVGSSGAVPSLHKLKRNKIVIEDDLTGYCIMAPIQSKKTDTKETTTATATATTTSSTTSSTSSGYSTGSYCSTTSSASSSNTNSSELNNKDLNQETLHPKKITSLPIESDYDLLPLRKPPIPVRNEQLPQDSGNIYENMQSVESPQNVSVILRSHENTPPFNNADFSGNLYENLLTIKAAQELEQPMPANICTSTPTDSSIEKDSSPINLMDDEQENYYQTPRKSLISVDDKVPSYYPNSCDTMKMKRGSVSPSKQTTPTTTACRVGGDKEKSANTLGLKHLVSIKMKRERKENLYISSPQKILEQRKKSVPNAGAGSTSSTNGGTTTSTNAITKSRRPQNAQKISENVYTVKINNKKSSSLSSTSSSLLLNNNNNNNTEKSSYNNEQLKDTAQLKEKLNTELLQIALLQNIDFKFDDATSETCTQQPKNSAKYMGSSSNDLPPPSSNNQFMSEMSPKESGIHKLQEAELEYENCYRATKDATRLLHKYATLAPKQSMRIQQQLQHHLQINQMSNAKELMTKSTKLESPVSVSGSDQLTNSSTAAVIGSKKFGSLPRFKKIDFSPLKLKINNVLQRNQQPDF